MRNNQKEDDHSDSHVICEDLYHEPGSTLNAVTNIYSVSGGLFPPVIRWVTQKHPTTSYKVPKTRKCLWWESV